MAPNVTGNELWMRPPYTILYQLAISSVVMGFTKPKSWARTAALPVIAGLVYTNIFHASLHMRLRWAGGFGSSSFALLQQYIDVALVSQLDYTASATRPKNSPDSAFRKFLVRSWYGWRTLWSWRHLNTQQEIRNAPRLRPARDSVALRRWHFVARRSLTAVVCYLLVDLIENAPQEPSATVLFHAQYVPVCRRWQDVTIEQVKLRFIAFGMFTFTFFNIIQCYYSAGSAIAVASGISKPEDWRPCFGSFTDAYSLKNVWGKVWHQHMRHFLWQPAKAIVYGLLGMSYGSSFAHAIAVILSFFFSGIMHSTADIATDPTQPWQELGAVTFFLTQACGVLLEEAVLGAVSSIRSKFIHAEQPSSLWVRALGYIWVVGFLTWSGPSWIYPQAAKAPVEGNFFLPFSVVRTIAGSGGKG